MKIRHEHIESVLLALAAEKGQAWVANAITEEYLRQGGGELRHRLCIFDTLERRALLAAQEALSTAIDAHDDAVQAVYRKAHFSGGGSSEDSVIVH
ncbi:hypothetical protein [Escherichia coli]|uniref:hypothetical protein n=1 Tax=Escherichia coli TaxID=562 RepID=UPI000BB78890|nr:hypothetical protein [Escherichia coli]